MLCYEFLYGVPPFEAESHTETYKRIINGEKFLQFPPPPRKDSDFDVTKVVISDGAQDLIRKVHSTDTYVSLSAAEYNACDRDRASDTCTCQCRDRLFTACFGLPDVEPDSSYAFVSEAASVDAKAYSVSLYRGRGRSPTFSSLVPH